MTERSLLLSRNYSNYSTNNKMQKLQKPRLVYGCCVVCFFIIILTLWMCPEPQIQLSAISTTVNPNHLVSPTFAPITTTDDDTCTGRRIFTYNLPSSFNTDLLELCDGHLVFWIKFCKHYRNYGFGEILNSSVPIFRDDWYGTDAYMLEVIFFERMLTYDCATSNPDEADLFFIPYFSGLDALPYLYGSKRARRQGKELISWLEANATESWGRFKGIDHFMIAGRTSWDFSRQLSETEAWGTSLFSEPALWNVTSMLLERKPWMGRIEQAIPYPVGFHPSTTASLTSWIDHVRNSNRNFLFSFSGALRPQMTTSIRGILSQQCANATNQCSTLDCSKIQCSHNPEPIYTKLLEADFCLQPRGDTATRRSTFDSILSGCIPVFFHKDTARTQYTWHLPSDFENWSVYIDEMAIKNGDANVQEILNRYSKERVIEMRERLISIIPNIVYRHPSGVAMANSMKDAFDLTIDGMARKVAAFKKSTLLPL